MVKATIETTDDRSDISPLTNEIDSSATTATDNPLTETDGRTLPKERTDVELYSENISSFGHDFEVVGIPNTHVIISKSYFEKLKKADRQSRFVKDACQYQRFRGGSSVMRSMMAVAVTSCPSLPLSQACNVIPMFVASSLIDAGVLDTAKVSSFSKSFPSESYLRDLVFSFAAENMYQLSIKLANKKIFLACDKGNKKGISHFVKVLSWYDPDTISVKKQLLDIDASGGQTQECGDAIAASLKKIGSPRLQGQTTDSGGGGVLDGLHKAIEERQLCSPWYLVTSCSLHNLQLAVANPIKEILGEGGLDKKNVMQMLHSITDLQESMEGSIWNAHVEEALDFLATYGSSNTPYIGETDGDKQFAVKWELVKTFHDFNNTMTDKEEKKVNFKIPVPVLTRWWSVGETARVTWSAYLLLIRISQQVINSTSSKPNKIASGLQPLMIELEIFSDLSLVTDYHTFFVSPHFDWMQSCTDMSGIPAFQSHNLLGRYFLLVQDLTELATSITTTHTGFIGFRRTLASCSPILRQHQEQKASKFIGIALEAIHKHFSRWCNVSLLPAALLSERPLALAVASVLLNKELPQEVGAMDFSSKVHDRDINIQAFHSFVFSIASNNDHNAYHGKVLHASQALFHGHDLREMEQHNDETKDLKAYLYSMYLPLASQTQFVEAGVKEAKNVSITDRSEMLRSAYAVARAARVHSIEDIRCLKSTQRVEALITNALAHAEEHMELKEANPDYQDKIDAITDYMREQHFREQRLQQAIVDALEKANKNKQENAVQKKVGVDRTHAMLDMFAYGKLKKSLHHDMLKVELLFRGCSEEEVNKMSITQRKLKLKDMEVDRLKDDPIRKDIATKAFLSLSGLQFRSH
jgi:hypothetical protein